MSTIEIGPLRAGPGTRVCGRLPVTNGVLADGTRVEIPLIIVNGAHDGPVLTVLAAVHGPEIVGTPAIINVSKALNPKTMRGAFIGVPAANPLGFVTGTRGWVLGHDLNRAFPGKSEGTIEERIAYTLFNEVFLRSTALIDYHTGGYMAPMVGYEYGSGELSRRSFELADNFGTALVWKVPKHPGTTHTEAIKRGIITLDTETECLPRRPVRRELVQLWERGIQNVMKALGILEGTPIVPERRIYFETVPEETVGGGFGTIPPVTTSGFMVPHVELKDEVRKGQKLATIMNLFGDEVDAIYAPYDDGIVLSMRGNVVKPGDRPISVGHRIPRGVID